MFTIPGPNVGRARSTENPPSLGFFPFHLACVPKLIDFMVTQSLWPANFFFFLNNNAISFQDRMTLIDARFSLAEAFLQKIRTSKLTHKSAVEILHLRSTQASIITCKARNRSKLHNHSSFNLLLLHADSTPKPIVLRTGQTL